VVVSRSIWSSPLLRCASRRSWRTCADAGTSVPSLEGVLSVEVTEEGGREREAARSASLVSGGGR